MKKFLLIWSLILAVSFSAFSQSESNCVAGELIVMLKPGSDIRKFKNLAEIQIPGSDITLKRELSSTYRIWLIGYNANYLAGPDALLKAVKSNSEVALAQHNHYVQLRATTPNDASFATQQWSLNNTGQTGGTTDADIDAPEAWDITTGGNTVQGDSIVVAVIDGGFQLNHPDLTANIYRNWAEVNGVTGVDDDNNGYVDDINGWDAYNNDGIIPSDQHGTHVSGIIGARGNNSIGVSGVNWRVKIMPIAGSSGTEAVVVAAYEYAAVMRRLYNQTNGVKGAYVVSTNSSFGVDLGSAANYPIWCAFYDSLGTEGILSAGATANANYNVDTQGDIPTSCPSNFLVSVTNTTNTDAKNNSCGYGLTTIDLGSPGTNVYNTVTNSGYQNLTGTSMATPHVAGAIGLMYAAACDNLISESKNNPAVIAAQMKMYLLNGTDPVASMNGITVTGGRLNVFKALQNVLTYPCDTTQPPNVSFVAANQSGCPGISVTFNNNTPGNNNTYLWSFPGGSPSSSTLENPTVTYNNLGSFDVTLIATNNYGSDTLLLPAYINVNNSSVTTIFNETFTGSDLNSLGWSTDNTDGNNTWELGTVGGNTPGNQAPYVNIFSNQSFAPTTDGLISPSIDLTNYSSVTLNFEHAHRRRVASIADSLRIYVSLDGGLTFPFRVFSRGGGGNPSVFATGALLTTAFTPSAAGDWCFADNTPGCFSVDLSQFDGQADVKLRFEIQNNGGNNIYIDNIKLSGICAGIPVLQSPIAQINAQNQTICEKQSVQFQDASQNGPTSWNWSFEGGQPATSTQPNPLVTYNTPGVYSVTLIVSNAAGADTSSLISYITVGATPVPPVISSNNNILQSSYTSGNQWYLNGSLLNGQTNPTLNPQSDGVYTVVYTSPEGCQATSDPFTFTSVSVENVNKINFTMFPNPAGDKVRIQWNSTGFYSVRLLDLTGRVVYSQSVSGNSVDIDLKNFADGIYLAELSGLGVKQTSKLIHKK